MQALLPIAAALMIVLAVVVLFRPLPALRLTRRWHAVLPLALALAFAHSATLYEMHRLRRDDPQRYLDRLRQSAPRAEYLAEARALDPDRHAREMSADEAGLAVFACEAAVRLSLPTGQHDFLPAPAIERDGTGLIVSGNVLAGTERREHAYRCVVEDGFAQDVAVHEP